VSRWQPVRATRREDIRNLGNTGCGANAGLDCSTIWRLSGSLGLALNQTPAKHAA